MSFCSYYQATIHRPDTWFVTSVLRSFEHVVFDRTIDSERGVFEFFVPPAGEECFVQVMKHFEQEGIVSDMRKLPNRLQDPKEIV